MEVTSNIVSLILLTDEHWCGRGDVTVILLTERVCVWACVRACVRVCVCVMRCGRRVVHPTFHKFSPSVLGKSPSRHLRFGTLYRPRVTPSGLIHLDSSTKVLIVVSLALLTHINMSGIKVIMIIVIQHSSKAGSEAANPISAAGGIPLPVEAG